MKNLYRILAMMLLVVAAGCIYDYEPEDGDIQGRIAFVALSVGIIAAVFRKEESHSMDAFIEIARLYSSEIEYSDENMQVLMDAWFEA